MGRCLRLEAFHGLMGELFTWRIDAVIQEMEKHKERGRILAFVRGLRLSAQLIYALRNVLPEGLIELSWGHLLDPDEHLCSPECDVIIHKPGGRIHRWNGMEKPVMDFSFVSCQAAVAVVSCKSLLTDVNGEYCRRMRKYVDKVFLFAECCRRKDVDRMARNARNAGYSGLCYLYTWEEDGPRPVLDEPRLEKFLNKLRALATRAA
jgi:hypothetical protein